MVLTLLLVLLILVGIALTGIILLQRSEGGGLVSGGGGGQFMSARGTANLLTKSTQILAAVFFSLILAITILSGRTHTANSVVDRAKVGSLDPAIIAQERQRQLDQSQQAPGKAAEPKDSGFGAPIPAPSLGGPLGGAPLGAPPPAAPAPKP